MLFLSFYFGFTILQLRTVRIVEIVNKRDHTPIGLGRFVRLLGGVRASGRLLLGLVFLLVPLVALTQTNLSLLTTAQQVLRLTSDQAKLRYPVRIEGVVTYVDEPAGQLFVQDKTGGIFVEIQGRYGFEMKVGQKLAVEGVSAPGGFAPDIEPQRVKLLGEARLPAPRVVTYEQMAAGQQDCNRVEFSGIVRAVSPNQFTPAGLDVVGGGGRVVVAIKAPEAERCRQLVDAEVIIRGVCIAHFNRKGQLIQVALQVPGMADISVRKPAPSDPFAIKLHKISNLLQYAPQEEHGHRVKVQGVVTLQQPGVALFIADETQGLCVQTRQRTPVQPGDRVEVVGFPAPGQYVCPLLQDGEFRKIGTGPPLRPLPITAEDGRRDTNHAALVQMEAVVRNRVETEQESFVELQSGSTIFTAHLEPAPARGHSLDAFPIGSRVRVTGICLIPADPELLAPGPQAFSLLLRSVGDVTLLERPSWWTVRHTLWVLAGTLAVFCASLGWVAVLRSQVKAQTQIIRQTVQREAALQERTRIARDLHDDLGASLTHISFVSGVAQKEKQSQAAVEEHLLEISGSAQRAFQALDEIVWVVNPGNDTLENLTNYICHFATDFFTGSTTRCRLDVPASLPERAISTETRNHLFLAVKEALNNVGKHAQASAVTLRIRLETEPEGPDRPTELERGRPVRNGEMVETGGREVKAPAQLWFCLSIEDNGKGFDPDALPSTGDGLPNLRSRLQKLGGRFSLVSHPGSGTTVRFAMPL
jgi:signal transduction histidine kinase